MRFIIDSNKSVSENAEYYYRKSKKAKKKIRGALKALEKTRKKLDGLDRKEQVDKKIPEKKEPRRNKKWFEIFRFFESSDNLLVVGGKDASTNESLIKKHTMANDLVFHSHVHGAPFFVVKNPEGVEVPDSTRMETAQAAASYSKAWSQGIGSVDVYEVGPEQVSKEAPAGEHLGKGAFMIYGRKRWYRNTPLGVAVGFKIGEDKVRVYGGPVNAVKIRTDYFLELTPGRKKSKELASEIREKIRSMAKKDFYELISRVNLQD
ncbi:MAG: NFACT RNA binding domain-containing protein, partial [Candidatus Altiarchaeota archaeon]|nr:NFACT RNA binding domain-containing protein [Candidatus Altiarchaeota archaeon]